MKILNICLFILCAVSIYGCSSGDEEGAATGAAQQAAETPVEVSQAETMEEIWASDLDPSEKARRVQELLVRAEN